MAKGPQDSRKLPINTNYFQGGTTVDPKLGIANSFYYSQNLDFRSQPSQMDVLPASRQLSNSLSDLVLAMDQDLNGVRWGVGSAGYIYKIDTSNTITSPAQLTENGSAGLLYNQVTDQLYIPGQTTVSMYGRVTKDVSPTFRSDHFAKSASVAPGCVNLFNSTDGFFDGSARNNSQSLGVGVTNVTQVTTNATNTYNVPTIISEASTNFCFFAPDIEPFYSVAVRIATKGTGNWTLTLHDSLNNSLAAITIANASLTNSAYNEFVFGSQIRALVNASQTGTTATYHFHLTSTVNDGTAQVLTASDLSTCDFLLFAYRLVQTQNGWHPTALFTGTGVPLLCIGNGNYLSTYNFGNDSNPLNTQWVRHQLFFKTGYEVCGLATNNQYLVIAVERRSNDSSRNYQDGALYFWSGSTTAPDFVIDIPMGAPYGLYTFNNVTYFSCAGSLFAWSGGQTVIKVRKLAYQNTDYLEAVDNTIVNPNSFTSRYNLLMMAYPSKTTNVNLNFGIWSWGTVELTFPNSYGLSYTLSPGILNYSSANNFQTGCCVNFVDSMYTSWQSTSGGVTTYGLDLVDNFSAAALSATWKSLIFDGGSRFKQKLATRLKISFTTLPTGCTVTPFYILDRSSKVSGTSGAIATAGATNAVMDINDRFHEIQYGFDVTCAASTFAPPSFTGVTLEIDPLGAEVEVQQDG